MKITYVLIEIILIVSSCTSIHSVIQGNDVATENSNSNNKIIVNNRNSTFSGSSEDKVIFKGENNLIEINSDSSQFNSEKSKDIIVVEGNNNNFQFNQKGITEQSKNTADTLVLRGNNQKSIFKITNSKTVIDTKVEIENKSNSTVLIFNESQEFVEEEDFEITVNSNELIYVPELETEISAGEALLFYQKEAKYGNLEAIFKLGTFYQYGIGCTRNIKKALDYYELAARKNHIEAQYSLGEIYEFGLKEISESKEKSNYYYTLAAKNGHPQAKLKIE